MGWWRKQGTGGPRRNQRRTRKDTTQPGRDQEEGTGGQSTHSGGHRHQVEEEGGQTTTPGGSTMTRKQGHQEAHTPGRTGGSHRGHTHGGHKAGGRRTPRWRHQRRPQTDPGNGGGPQTHGQPGRNPGKYGDTHTQVDEQENRHRQEGLDQTQGPDRRNMEVTDDQEEVKDNKEEWTGDACGRTPGTPRKENRWTGGKEGLDGRRKKETPEETTDTVAPQNPDAHNPGRTTSGGTHNPRINPDRRPTDTVEATQEVPTQTTRRRTAQTKPRSVDTRQEATDAHNQPDTRHRATNPRRPTQRSHQAQTTRHQVAQEARTGKKDPRTQRTQTWMDKIDGPEGQQEECRQTRRKAQPQMEWTQTRK
ncbi:voltage-dependent P/Q-type calcium channel subunit alpha-1A-like [Haliotis rubra]|uniref:voltage-dependent P/Q-type calcium channel subunit alpha-1A-like n=1 Tax=Haliotis rubra TaxID=36100 RepID=UPI001EE61C2F|nr:voltage-dependent P/Q-type calcium channel subunit alpha-1A-like [Haliotis rubra]